MSVRVVFSIGSNCGAKESNVRDAIETLRARLGTVVASHIYETPDAGGSSVRYFNAVVAADCMMTFAECENLCKRMEILAGRDAFARERGEVPLDVDIVVWDESILKPWDFRQKFFTIGYARIQAGSYPS